MRWRLLAGLAVLSGVVVAEPPEVVITGQIPLAERAQTWGLSEAEFRRYQSLMAGQRGQWSPGLDPITALGVSTDSEAERRRFAELFVKTEFERTRKELAFQVAVDDAWQRLYSQTPRLSTSGLPQQAQTVGQFSQHTAMILRLGSTTGRDRVIKLLQRHQGQLDVHVVGARGNDAALRDWAADFPLLEQALAEGRATLNHGDQFRTEVDLPAIYRRDGVGQWARVE
jgi:integrating conjugative element protein (TIGR03759 family)